ncbi:nitrite reductase small subunit NirD [Cellulomonas fimi]|uniref:nitrite reductase small subunit NirD n=1 Tax=Cellulomonas fimi TaxID=1708 RepID=UPI002359E3D9|nr:nitrite reductase small subunit NirD [Cellulomonas fimi]
MTTTTTVSTDVCGLDALVPERGAAALVDGVQVALFRLADDTVLAVQNRDPFAGANVVARGIVGSVGDTPTVTSPMHKQVWDLRTGECLDTGGKTPRDDVVDLATWTADVVAGRVLVRRT